MALNDPKNKSYWVLCLLLAALLLPPLRDDLDPDSSGVGDIGQLVAQAIAPALERLRPSRRDAELARQILLALRYVLPSKNPTRRRYRLDGREFADDARQLAEIVADAESVDVTLVGQPIVDEGAPATAAAPSGDEELAAPPLQNRGVIGLLAGEPWPGAEERLERVVSLARELGVGDRRRSWRASAGRLGRERTVRPRPGSVLGPPPGAIRIRRALVASAHRSRFAGRRCAQPDHARASTGLPGPRQLRRPLEPQ